MRRQKAAMASGILPTREALHTTAARMRPPGVRSPPIAGIRRRPFAPHTSWPADWHGTVTFR